MTYKISKKKVTDQLTSNRNGKNKNVELSVVEVIVVAAIYETSSKKCGTLRDRNRRRRWERVLSSVA